MVGWIVVGLLTSVTGELILPGRNPVGIDIALLLGAALPPGALYRGTVAGSRCEGVRRRGDPLGHPGSVRGARDLPVRCESSSTVGGARNDTCIAAVQHQCVARS